MGDNDVTIEQKSVRPHLTIILSLQWKLNLGSVKRTNPSRKSVVILAVSTWKG